MKKFTTGLLALLLAATSVQAQSKEETRVAASVEQLRQLMVTPDSLRLHSILSDGLSYGHSSGLVEDKASLMRNLLSGRSDFVNITLSGQTVQVMDKTAIVRHTFEASTNDGGRPGQVKIAVLTVWQQNKKDWQLIARQAVRLTQ